MSNLTQEILFPNSGLNTDDANAYKSLGDSEYRLNILVGEEGSNGVITNSKGNRLASYPLSNSNAYQVVGSYYNQLTRKCYYFVFSQPHDWSTSGDYIYDNKLLCFDEDDETIILIFEDTVNYFGLSLNYPVKDCDMLGDMLYFNPRISEPKMIDVVRAQNFTDYDAWQPSPTTYIYGQKVRFFGGLFLANTTVDADHSPSTHPDEWDRIGDSYLDEETNIEFDSEFRYAFNVIRHIPVYRPVCIYGTDDTKYSNNVRSKLFRFTHRYKFFDDTYSLFGAYSDIVIPWNDEYWNGEVSNYVAFNNLINVTIPLHSPALIKEIEIIFQETGKDWKKAKIINRQEQELLPATSYTYRFYNTDSAYEVVDETLLEEIYDSVPKRAATQELINKNILAYGRPAEGFPNIDKNDIDVSLTPEIEDIVLDVSESKRRDNLLDYNAHNFTNHSSSVDWYDVWDAVLGEMKALDFSEWYDTSGIGDGDLFEININGQYAIYLIQLADIASLDIFGEAMAAFIRDSFPLMEAASFDPVIDVLYITNVTSLTVSYFYSIPGTEFLSITKRRGFKTGAWHPFCLYYYDGAMRRADAQTSKENTDTLTLQMDGTTVYVPMLGEASEPGADTTAHKWNINWEINHLPPTWAKWWRWGYAGNALCSYFVQYIIEDLIDETPYTKIDIAPLQTLKDPETGWNQFPQSIIEPYAWQHGDRVRIITEKSADNNLGVVLDGVYDFEIFKYEETDDDPIKYYIYVQLFGHAAINVDEDSLIEIYRPIKTDTAQAFYEFGELMPIIEDSDGFLVHGVGITGTQNQDTSLGTSATGVFTAGDVYHILRTPSKPIDTTEGYFHESQWYSDFYDSDDYDRGRIGFETSYGERTLNIIRYSNQYLQNTGINGLSTFEGDHYKELTDVYGDVVSMVEVGTTLKVYLDKKSASILIGRQEYLDSEGKSTIATSNVVLGAIRYPENNFGTQWIESVSKNNRYVYGFDVYNAVLWRDSANGIFPISGRYEDAGGGTGDYKMATWFKEKSDALMLSGIENIKVLTVWDEKYKNLYVTFKDHVNNDNNDTIVYHEPSNRWICYTDFDLTPDGGFNEMLELDYWKLIGFEGGIGYSFNEDTRFAEFNIGTGLGTSEPPPVVNPTDVFIVDEDGVTLIITEDGTTYIIED